MFVAAEGCDTNRKQRVSGKEREGKEMEVMKRTIDEKKKGNERKEWKGNEKLEWKVKGKDKKEVKEQRKLNCLRLS